MSDSAPSDHDAKSNVADPVTTSGHGHEPELKRHFSMISMLGLAFAILNSWTALASSLSLALPSGGPASVIWGLVTAGICTLCLGASNAEFLSAWPTSAGQYYWAAAVSWPSSMRLVSWITGWINTAGWIALSSTGGLLGSQTILGIVALVNPSYVAERWHQFLIYLAFTVIAFIFNAFAIKLLPLFNKVAFFWSIASFAVISITLLACASPNYSSGRDVYATFINNTGWPDGVAWLLGLLQGSLGLVGFDAVAHMCEEIPNPTVYGPAIMVGSIGIGIFTGFIFLSVLLFVLHDIDSVISSSSGPLLQIFYDATNSKVGSSCLGVLPLFCLVFATVSIMTTSSRMTYAFARDGGLPFSRVFARVHPVLNVPLNALILTTALVIAFGCVFLGSSSAFNAITSASVVALGLTYAIPPAINCLRGRKMLPEDRTCKLVRPLGWICNLVGIGYALLTTVFFLFPPMLPVTGENMNYCVVAFAIVLIISTVQWFLDGRKNFKGPLMVVFEGGHLTHIEGVESSPHASVSDIPTYAKV